MLKQGWRVLGIMGLLGWLLAGCGDEATVRPGNPTNSPIAAGSTPTAPETAAVATPLGTRTAVAFFSPSPATTTSPGYILVFERQNNLPLLEASLTTPLPQGGANDWQIEINGEGIAKYTANPRDKTKAAVQEYFLNQEKLDSLLQQLGKLGVLEWPDTTPPKQAATGGASRGLVLSLKGRPKQITDLSGNTNDGLSQMLDLIKQTVQAAPPRKSP